MVPRFVSLSSAPLFTGLTPSQWISTRPHCGVPEMAECSRVLRGLPPQLNREGSRSTVRVPIGCAAATSLCSAATNLPRRALALHRGDGESD